MGKKKKIIDRRNGDVSFPKNLAAVKRYILLYLERKMENPNDISLETQKSYLIQILQANGVFHATFDDDFLRRFLVEGQIKPVESCKKHEKKSFPSSSNSSSACGIDRQRKYQNLLLMYQLYINRRCGYSKYFAAFQAYFDAFVDVYEMSLENALSLTKSLIRIKEEK